MRVYVSKKDIENAQIARKEFLGGRFKPYEYFRSNACPLAQALHRLNPKSKAYVYDDEVYIENGQHLRFRPAQSAKDFIEQADRSEDTDVHPGYVYLTPKE